MATQQPSRIGPYRILGSLTEGGMAHLYHAVDSSENLEVALKVLKPEAEGFVSNLRATGGTWEGDIAIRLDHPNVVQTFECGDWKDTRFIAMELLAPFTLKYFVGKSSPVVGASKYRILYEVAKAIAYVHRMGFVHRDVSAKNVLVTEKGAAKLIDFGLAMPKIAGDTRRRTRSGTLGYMPPEQFRGEECDARSDVFAFGVTMYEVLTGGLPSEPNGGREAAVVQPAPPPSSCGDSSITGPIDELVLTAMANEPDERFQSMPDLIQAMRAAFPNDALAGSPGRDRQESRRFRRISDQCFVRLKIRRYGLFTNEYRTLTRDFSLGGLCCISLRAPVAIGSRLEANLLLRGEGVPLPLRGEVAWCRQGAGQDRYEVGVSFKGLSKGMRAKIEKYVASRKQAGSRRAGPVARG